jgi:hypothetical protein
MQKPGALVQQEENSREGALTKEEIMYFYFPAAHTEG